MAKTPRIIELPSKTTSQLTTELQPAYERPIDPASVDARMGDQLDWEARGRATPKASVYEEVAMLSEPGKPERKRKINLKRILALGTLVVGGTAATVGLIERAYDQQQQFYKPATPELADQPKK